MGIFGRKSTSSKAKSIANVAISRIDILKKQHRVRCSYARSDVVQLLHLDQYDQALLRAAIVIKEENTCDALVMIESYCRILIDRNALVQTNIECPIELKEAIPSLIFASSRFGEFPELQQLRDIFVSIYGQQFALQCVELSKNCGVNPKLIEKLSTHQTCIENRLKVVEKIAAEGGITK